MIIELLLIGGAASFWKKNKGEIQDLARRFQEATRVDGRQQLKVDLDPELKEAEQEARQEAKKQTMLSVGAAGLALAKPISPILPLAGTGIALYLARGMFSMIRDDFKEGRFLTVYSMGAFTMVGMLAMGKLLLVTLGGLMGGFFHGVINRLEENSSQQLVNIFGHRPDKVWVLQDGIELEVDFHELQKGDAVVVNPGEVIPADGVVQSGTGQVDQHLLTGESIPVEKAVGDPVFAATLLLTGRLVITVEQAGTDTVASKIGDALHQTQSYKDSLRNQGMEIADQYVPATLGVTGLTYMVLGSQPALAVSWSGLGQLMAGLGPLTVLSYLQVLSQRGILVKDGRVFESLGQVDTLVFDKTGTLTLDQPKVGAIHKFGSYKEENVLRFAAAAEYRQPHPIAKAILEKAEDEGVELPEVGEASYKVGFGIEVTIEDKTVHVGSARFLEQSGIKITPRASKVSVQVEEAGHSLVYVGINKRLAGALELQPTIRPEAVEMIQAVKDRGLQLHIISGDREAPTRQLAKELGIDHYFAEVLPKNKATIVQQLQDEGRFVCFVGDGINDAIALKTARVSISLKGASTAATDTAQIVFMDGTLNPLNSLFDFADKFEDTMRKNKTISMVPGYVTITGVYLFHLGIASSMAIFYLGSFAGLGNVLQALIENQESETAPMALERVNRM